MVDVSLEIEAERELALSVDGATEVALSVDGTVFSPTEYHGTTTVTPSSERQVLATAGTALIEDIVVNPIPSNYGLVTWDGSTLSIR